jgi:arylsulfatase B
MYDNKYSYYKQMKLTRFTGIAMIVVSGCTAVADQKPEKPNILVIVVDDLGYADLSFLPQAPGDVQTPNIDRIASNGTYFSNAYASTPICSPARVGLLTGQYQQRWGNYWYGEGGLPDSIPTIPELLKSAGYYTVKIGKTHLNGGPVEHPLDHGFDEFLGFIGHSHDYLRLSSSDVEEYGRENAEAAYIGPLLHNRELVSYEEGYTTDIFSDKAVEEINSKKEKPFYIQLEYNAVHGPTYVCHPDYLQKFGLEQFPFWDPETMSRSEWTRRNAYLGDIDPDGRKRYLLQLTVMDDGIGRIYKALETSGKLDNTIVFFVSDNGGDYLVYSDNSPFNGNKYMYAEGGIRVPFIVSWPAYFPVAQTNSQLSSTMDIFPTIMESAGIDISHSIDGVSLIPAILNTNPENTRDHLVFSNGRDSWLVRKGPWKLSHYTGWQTHNRFSIVDGVCIRDTVPFIFPNGIRLVNLEEDLSESSDLSEKYPEIVEELSLLYSSWNEQMSMPRNRDGELKSRRTQGEEIPSAIKTLQAQIVSSNFNDNNYPVLAIDGFAGTYWSSSTGYWVQPLPHDFTIRLKDPITINGFTYLPVQGNSRNKIKEYSCQVSMDGENWHEILSGSFDNKNDLKTVQFKENVEVKYINLHIISTYDNSGVSGIAEFDLLLSENAASIW